MIATQWRVGDRSTVRLVADLYDGLARGLTVAEALREAKLAALRRGAPPGEWAGFSGWLPRSWWCSEWRAIGL